VLNDLFNKAVSEKFVRKVYGVVLDEGGQAVDQAETRKLREQARAARLEQAKPVNADRRRGKLKTNAPPVMRIHEYLDIVQQDDVFSIACRKCKEDFGPADGNYKNAAVFASVDKDALTELPPPSGRHSMGRYIEYYCPGCATLLEVEVHVPSIEGETIEPVWDTQITPDAFRKAAAGVRSEASIAAE
jgi:acetone carboxylase gamma subunit